jgi:hypothetical protein
MPCQPQSRSNHLANVVIGVVLAPHVPHLFQAVGAHAVRSLRLAAPRALAQVVDVLEGLAGHLPVPLAGMRRLVLGDRAQDRLPDVVQEVGQVDAPASDSGREHGEGSGYESSPARGAQDHWRGQAGEERRGDGGHVGFCFRKGRIGWGLFDAGVDGLVVSVVTWYRKSGHRV